MRVYVPKKIEWADARGVGYRRSPGFYNLADGEALAWLADGRAWRVSPGDVPIEPLPSPPEPEFDVTKEEDDG